MLKVNQQILIYSCSKKQKQTTKQQSTRQIEIISEPSWRTMTGTSDLRLRPVCATAPEVLTALWE